MSITLLLILSPLLLLFAGIAFWQWLHATLVPARVREAARCLDTDETRAMRLLSSVLALDSRNLQALWLTAQLHRKRKQLVLAKMCLLDILHMDKFDALVTETQVRGLLAQIYEALEEHEKAVVQYSILREKGDLDPSGYRHLIRLHLDKGRLDEAGRILTHTKNMGIEDGEIAFLEGLFLFRQKDFRLAEQKLVEAGLRHYLTLERDRLLGQVLFINGKFAEALRQFQTLPDPEFQNHELESMLGQCFFHLKDYDAAIRSLEGIIQRLDPATPAFSEACFILGCAYENKSLIPRALEQWKRVDHHSRFHRSAQEKILFYTAVIKDRSLQHFLSAPFVEFRMAAERLLECLGYSVKERLYEDERTLEFFCVNQDHYYSYDTHLVHITRQTAAIAPDFIGQKLRTLQARRGKYLCIIAPHVPEDTRTLARQGHVQLHDFAVFAQYGLIRTPEEGEAPILPEG